MKNNWKVGIPLPRYNRTSYTSCTNKYHMGVGLILQACFKARLTSFRGKVPFQCLELDSMQAKEGKECASVPFPWGRS